MLAKLQATASKTRLTGPQTTTITDGNLAVAPRVAATADDDRVRQAVDGLTDALQHDPGGGGRGMVGIWTGTAAKQS